MSTKAQADYVIQYATTHNLSYGQAKFQLERGLAHRNHVIKFQKLHMPEAPSAGPRPTTPRDRSPYPTIDQVTGADGLLGRVMKGEGNPHSGRLHVTIHEGNTHVGDLVLNDEGRVEAHPAPGRGPAIDILRRTFKVQDEASLRHLAEEVEGATLVDDRDGHDDEAEPGPFQITPTEGLDVTNSNDGDQVDDLDDDSLDDQDDDQADEDEGNYYHPRRDGHAEAEEDDRDGPKLRYTRRSDLYGPRIIYTRRGEAVYYTPPIDEDGGVL